MAERAGTGRKQARAKTPWHAAIRAADIPAIRSLIAAGQDVNALDEYSQTALMNAVYWGNFEVAKLLIDEGADLNHAAKLGLTALYLAVINKKTEFVQLLMDAGADTSLKGSKGQYCCTPAEYAEQYGYSDVVKILRRAT